MIVLGVSLAPGEPFGTLILQIETPEADQRRDGWGLHAEVDEAGAYEAVEEFDFDPQTAVLRVVLRLPGAPTSRLVLIPLAEGFGPRGRALLTRMVQVFRSYPRRAER